MSTEIDLYSTHIEYLIEIFKFKGKTNKIIEFGTGFFSTEFFINNGKEVTSIEMQSEDWYNQVKSKFEEKENWIIHKCLGPYTFMNLDIYQNTDFCFVDGHGDSRPECINFMIENNCPIIVSHDTEENGYGWERVKNKENYKTHTFKKHKNWTTIWTSDNELYENMINFL